MIRTVCLKIRVRQVPGFTEYRLKAGNKVQMCVEKGE